jgi:hypothetical protein
MLTELYVQQFIYTCQFISFIWFVPTSVACLLKITFFQFTFFFLFLPCNLRETETQVLVTFCGRGGTGLHMAYLAKCSWWRGSYYESVAEIFLDSCKNEPLSLVYFHLENCVSGHMLHKWKIVTSVNYTPKRWYNFISRHGKIAKTEVAIFLCCILSEIRVPVLCCMDQSSSVHEIYSTRLEVVEQVPVRMPPNRALPHRADVTWV